MDQVRPQQRPQVLPSDGDAVADDGRPAAADDAVGVANDASPLSSRRSQLAVAGVSVAAFLALGALVASGLTSSADRFVVGAFATVHGGPLDLGMRLLSLLGEGTTLAIVTAIVAAFLIRDRRSWAAAYVVVALAVLEWSTLILKVVYLRPRPGVAFDSAVEIPHTLATVVVIAIAVALLAMLRPWRTPIVLVFVPIAAFGLLVDRLDPVAVTAGVDSFPSGHALRSIGLALSVVVSVGARRSSLVTVVAIVAVALIGFSRVYLGEHYPTDVLGGWLAGSAIALALAGIVSLDRHRPVRRPSLEPLPDDGF